MDKIKKVFKNYFQSKEVSDPRLVTFSDDTKGRLEADNEGNDLTPIITNIAASASSLEDQLGDVQGSIAVQKGKTFTVDGVIKNFKVFMSENEGVIAKAVGGKKTEAFIQFYPNGVKQYSSVTKGKLPALLGQLTEAININKTKLGPDLTAELSQFASQYESTRTDQTKQKGKLNDSRTDRSQERKNLEKALMIAMYTIGIKYVGNEEKCASFFNFSLLDAPAKKSKKEAKKA